MTATKKRKKRKENYFMRQVIAVCVALFIVLCIVDFCSPTWGFFARVPVGNVAVVTHFGEIKNDAVEPGLHAKGFFDHYNCLDTRTQKIQSQLAAFSKDMQEVNVEMTVNYNVSGSTAVKLFKEVNTDYDNKIIKPVITEAAKVVFAKYTAEELITHRGQLADEIKTAIVEALDGYDINISLVTINDIDFSDAFTNAVEAKQVATQEKLRAQTEQEQETIKAQAEAERKVIAAQAEADAVKAKADAEAYAIKIKAEAEAEANSKIAESITAELIDYNKINQWDGVLPTTVVGGDGTTTTLIPIQ